jgi:hypothetical protein
MYAGAGLSEKRAVCIVAGAEAINGKIFGAMGITSASWPCTGVE